MSNGGGACLSRRISGTVLLPAQRTVAHCAVKTRGPQTSSESPSRRNLTVMLGLTVHALMGPFNLEAVERADLH